MIKFLQHSVLLIAVALLGTNGAVAQELRVQNVTPPANLRAIELQPGTAKHLPLLFIVATKTRLFLALAEDIKLSDEQKAKLEEIHRDLQTRVQNVKVNYDKKNEGLQVILSSDHIVLDDMRENLRDAEQLKAEMQYCLFESLVRAANVLTPEQRLKIVQTVQPPTAIDDLK